MRQIIGKYTTADIMTDNYEEEVISFLYSLVDNPAFEDNHIVLQPDTHAGMGCAVGCTYSLKNYINPSHIGVDIGCCVSGHKMSKFINPDDYALIEHRIKETVPMGFDIHDKTVIDEKKFYAFLNSEYGKCRSANPDLVPEIGRIDEKFISKMLSRVGMDAGIFYKSIGTLGGGNHFISVECSDNESYLLIHSGSRNFGNKVARYWIKIAENNKPDKNLLKAKIEQIKSECSERRLLKDLIAKAKEDAKSKNPNGYLSGDNMLMYISDMIIAQAYAKYSHITMRDRIFDVLMKFGIKQDESIFTIHNYIDVCSEHPMVRKGAISAYEGEKMLIPFNMKDGTSICIGKGNEEWNFSAPHGAGRIMSRTAAKKNISIDDYKKSMEGIYSTSVNIGTIDESPMVYKPYEEIVELIEPTVEVIAMLKPVINIKAGGEE